MLGFSHIAWPLNQVIKGGYKGNLGWTKSQQKALDDLKYRLCSALVLSLPDLPQPFEMEKYALD